MIYFIFYFQITPLHDVVVQTLAQPSSATTTMPMESREQPVSEELDDEPRTPPQRNTELSASTELISAENNSFQANISPRLRHNSTPNFKDTISAIARPRASATKNVNLMDASPWQLLPPPKSKQTVKKSLTLDGLGSDSSLASPASNESVDTLVTIDKNAELAMFGVKPLPADETEQTLEVIDKHKPRPRNLSKEKSRSIDSLRSDVSESSRTNRRDSRPR